MYCEKSETEIDTVEKRVDMGYIISNKQGVDDARENRNPGTESQTGNGIFAE